MSAVNVAQTGAEAWERSSGGTYRVIDERAAFHFSYGGFVIFGPRGEIMDRFRTRSGAEHAAGLLNHDLATVNPHGLIGRRVEARS